ncbi:hypothetical protein DFH29DRAFT_897923 [Suillus ampliporus]|nr:hypothetical protein DFH29DRAFT_897923 [Suillus ampliporus]
MPRGNNNDRGRGSRGRRRGQFHDDDTRGGTYPHSEMDFVVQVWQEPPSNSALFEGRSPWRGRGGRSRPGFGYGYGSRGGSTPRRGMGTRGRGLGRGRGRGDFDAPRARPGFGHGRNRNGPDSNTPLSKLLSSERPYLRPVIFVPSVHTRTLFEEVEEILQPVVRALVCPSEESHVPTADRVTRVFSGRNLPPPSSSSSEDGISDHEEELEEVDFADMGSLLPKLDTARTSTSARVPQMPSSPSEERNHTVGTPSSRPASKHANVTPKKPVLVSTHAAVSKTTATSVHGVTTLEHSTAALVITQDKIIVDKPETIHSPDTPTFFVDTEPTRPSHRSASDVVLFDRGAWGGAPLGEEDELIVYVAPHPRSGRASPVPDVPRVHLPSRSLLTNHQSCANQPHEIPIQSNEPPQFSSVSFDFTSPTVKKQSRQRSVFTPGDRSKCVNVLNVGRCLGPLTLMNGAQGRFVGSLGGRMTLTLIGVTKTKTTRFRKTMVLMISNGLGGMDLDPDLEPSLEAMKGFVQSMSAEGSRHITMDDIQDQEQEDEEDDDGSDSHGSYNDTSDEEDKEENAVFEVEEEMLIAESEGGRPQIALDKTSDRHTWDDSDESRGDDDDRYTRTNRGDMLDMHSDMAGSKSRKLRNKVFRAIQMVNLTTYEEMEPAKRKKDKMKEAPAELREIWEKDRKGGKKGRKAMRTAEQRDPSMLPQSANAIVDMESLEKQIRRFISDAGGKNSIVLPAMDKASRKEVHELANAFNLKSHSKGKGYGRYITLTKATKTRTANEQKVKSVMKRHGGRFDTMPRHKDGDEVGKAAPKIGETNLGFRMLASMGWAEGDRIGGDSSTGIDAPLTAIIKNTKLGLGATR